MEAESLCHGGRSLRRLLRLFGFFVLDGGLHGADEHVRVASFQARLAFDGAVRGEIRSEAHQQLLAEIGVRDFTAAELHHCLHAIAFLKEADGVVLFEIVIVIVGVGAELELLHLHHVLLLPCVVRLLLLLVLVVAEIDGFGDRRLGGGRDQDKIEPQILCFAQRSRGRHDFGSSIGEDGAHFAHTDGLVHVLSAILPARRKISRGIHSLSVQLKWKRAERPGTAGGQEPGWEKRSNQNKASRSVYNKKGGATTGENRDLATDAQRSPGRTAIFWLLLAGIAAAAGTMEVRSVLDETQTWDEGIHISAGYSYLTLGDYSWNTEHPPLVKLICALPLTWMGLKAERFTADGRLKDQIQYGKDFLYENRKHADTILFAARAPNIALTLMFLVGLGWWVRRRWGAIAGLIAAALCAFDPNLIAHGRYVTTDYPLTVFFFFACVLWAEYLDIGGRRRLLIASVAIAVAMVVKFSALLLIPPLALLYALCWIRRPAEFGGNRTLVAGAGGSAGR